jgi:hypothetical protein
MLATTSPLLLASFPAHDGLRWRQADCRAQRLHRPQARLASPHNEAAYNPGVHGRQEHIAGRDGSLLRVGVLQEHAFSLKHLDIDRPCIWPSRRARVRSVSRLELGRQVLSHELAAVSDPTIPPSTPLRPKRGTKPCNQVGRGPGLERRSLSASLEFPAGGMRWAGGVVVSLGPAPSQSAKAIALMPERPGDRRRAWAAAPARITPHRHVPASQTGARCLRPTRKRGGSAGRDLNLRAASLGH